MNEESVASLIKDKFSNIEVQIPAQPRRVHIKVDKSDIDKIAVFLKEHNFSHLSFITCVDWIDDGKFELVYGIWSYEYNIHILLKTMISRENPQQKSLMFLWDQAITYERDIHEMFGVVFTGNPNLTPFILENWEGIPPMRKDFDSRKYSQMIFDSEAD